VALGACLKISTKLCSQTAVATHLWTVSIQLSPTVIAGQTLGSGKLALG
jgi:hypothetical protein